jgi:hypothetical protein
MERERLRDLWVTLTDTKIIQKDLQNILIWGSIFFYFDLIKMAGTIASEFNAYVKLTEKFRLNWEISIFFKNHTTYKGALL